MNWGGERLVDKHSTVYLHGQMTSVEEASASVVQSLSPRELSKSERAVDKHSTVYLHGQMTSVEAVARTSVFQSLSPRELGRGEVSR